MSNQLHDPAVLPFGADHMLNAEFNRHCNSCGEDRNIRLLSGIEARYRVLPV